MQQTPPSHPPEKERPFLPRMNGGASWPVLVKNRVQKILLVGSIIALLFLLVEIGLSVAATQHGSTPARSEQVTAGPYALTVKLYDNPARAGFALPFSIAPQQQTQAVLSYKVISIPKGHLSATPVKASVSPDPNIANGVQGAAEITVRGPWSLHIEVTGPQGLATVDVPITADTLPALPSWFGWLFGLLPVYGLLAFLVYVRNKKTSEFAPA